MGADNVLTHSDTNPSTWGILVVCVGLYFLIKWVKPEWFDNE